MCNKFKAANVRAEKLKKDQADKRKRDKFFYGSFVPKF